MSILSREATVAGPGFSRTTSPPSYASHSSGAGTRIRVSIPLIRPQPPDGAGEALKGAA